jgi:hypothetical protein
MVQFKDVSKKFPKFLTYVETTILINVKEKFVRAWTNHVLHLVCTTTNRVESPHGKLKKYLIGHDRPSLQRLRIGEEEGEHGFLSWMSGLIFKNVSKKSLTKRNYTSRRLCAS